ncbi:MAG: SRPBCC family protein [Actinomycetota bacterium]|nr:SRPBCC family protein [Actinomycetota bacterium]
MELVNSFSVNVPIDRAWALLTDVEKIAPCLPGAQLEEIEGDEFRGSVKVKVGPITASYKGKASFIELNSDTHTAVLRAEGRDTKGAGNASATVTAILTGDETKTDVSVNTNLAITGKVASFGRGVLADVSNKLLTQFVASLEELIANDGVESEASSASGDASTSAEGEPGATQTTEAAPSENSATNEPSAPKAEPVKKVFEPKEQEPVDLLGAVGSPLIKRLVPAVAGTVFFLVLVFIRRARRAKR